MKYAMVLAGMLAIAACEPSKDTWSPKQGDLLFLGSIDSDLSEAISEVTQTEMTTSYSHIGIVAAVENGIEVIHAAPKKGVVQESIDSFKGAILGTKMYAYRINDISQKEIGNALKTIQSLLGAPYNFSYIMQDTGYYCSELVYEAFKQQGVFSLHPMTFKMAETENFHKTWIEHYGNLGIPIPEGLPGCNPNGMAADSNLVYLGEVIL